MENRLRTYDLAVQFYRHCKAVKLPQFLRQQLLRASSSVALNLLEGNAKSSLDDRCRFFEIALGSLRESTAICDLEPTSCQSIRPIADQLGASLFCLIRALRK
jgi:four helix bundle protein